jgi:hypothetical protein
MRNGRAVDRENPFWVMGVEPVLLIGTRSADYIRASGHAPRKQAGHMTCTRPQAARQNSLATRASFSNRCLGCKHNFRPDHFFCSTAPQAFFRPDRKCTGRRAQTLSRLAAFFGGHRQAWS